MGPFFLPFIQKWRPGVRGVRWVECDEGGSADGAARPAGSEPACARATARPCWDACGTGLARARSGAPACPHMPRAAPSQGFRARETPASDARTPFRGGHCVPRGMSRSRPAAAGWTPACPQPCPGPRPRPSPSCALYSEQAPGIWWLSFSQKKKKNANKTDSYHCFLKVTAGVPARMNLTDSKHRCAGSACSRCDAETLTSVPTAPHGCLMGLQDGGASPAGPRGAKGPGARLLRAWGRARGRWPGRLPSAPPAHCPGRTREQDIVPPGACGSRWLPNQRDEHTGQKHEAEERPVRSQPEAPPPGSGDDAPSTAGRCQRQRPGVPRGRREAWPG